MSERSSPHPSSCPDGATSRSGVRTGAESKTELSERCSGAKRKGLNKNRECPQFYYSALRDEGEGKFE